jgi:hypothetical protein
MSTSDNMIGLLVRSLEEVSKADQAAEIEELDEHESMSN